MKQCRIREFFLPFFHNFYDFVGQTRILAPSGYAQVCSYFLQFVKMIREKRGKWANINIVVTKNYKMIFHNNLLGMSIFGFFLKTLTFILNMNFGVWCTPHEYRDYIVNTKLTHVGNCLLGGFIVWHYPYMSGELSLFFEFSSIRKSTGLH